MVKHTIDVSSIRCGLFI